MPSQTLFPQIPSYLAHEDQLTPTPAATQLLFTLLPRPLTDWKLADFTTHGHAGLSTLISLFVDYVTREGGMSTKQRGLVAKRACITHPARLLHMIRTGDHIEDYVQRSRTMISPPMLEDQLCPARTSDLVANDGLRSRIHDPKLTRGDLLQIILPYAQHFYSSASDLPTMIRRMSLLEITGLVYTPGEFCHGLPPRGKEYTFHPPCWYKLRQEPHPPTPSSAVANTFHPLLHMGVTLLDFCALPPTAQKSTALTAIPEYLADKLPPASILTALIAIGKADPAEIISLLQPANFHALLGIPPPVEMTSQITYRYHLAFKHNGGSPARCWRGQANTILNAWLRGVLPMLTQAGYTLTLTSSPHLITTDDLAIDHTNLHMDTLHYIHKIHPRPSKFKRFEVWLTSDCPAFDSDIEHYFTGDALASYRQLMCDTNLWVQHIERYMSETVPCVLLVNSFSRDRDDLVVKELQQRLQQADLTTSGDPPFYTTWCSVATSDLSHSTMAKCIMAHPLVAPALTMAIMELPLDDMADFLVTEGYIPLPIPPHRHLGMTHATTRYHVSSNLLLRWSPHRFLDYLPLSGSRSPSSILRASSTCPQTRTAGRGLT